MTKTSAPRLPESLHTEKTFTEILETTEREISEYSFKNERIVNVASERIMIDSSLLTHCSFIHCNFKRGHFSDIVFQDCDLSNMILTGSAFTRVEFRGCKLTGTNLMDVNLYQVLFTDCRGEYVNLSVSKQRDVFYQNSLLRGAALNDCLFSNVSFSRCNLMEAEFYQTSLKGIDFTDSEITGTRVNQLPFNEWKGATVTTLQAVELAKLLGININD